MKLSISPEYGHCLRDQFTLELIKTLIGKKSPILLIGTKGTGKTRLLKDIIQCNIPDTRIALLTPKSLSPDPNTLPATLHTQLNLPPPIPETISQLLLKIESESLHYLLFVDDFTNLPASLKPQTLKTIATQTNISLLITAETTNPALLREFPDLKPQMIPPLTRSEILRELERQCDQYSILQLKGNPDDKEMVINAIFHEPAYYTMLCFLAKKINTQVLTDETVDFPETLNHWLKEYHTLQKDTFCQRCSTFISGFIGKIFKKTK